MVYRLCHERSRPRQGDIHPREHALYPEQVVPKLVLKRVVVEVVGARRKIVPVVVPVMAGEV